MRTSVRTFKERPVVLNMNQHCSPRGGKYDKVADVVQQGTIDDRTLDVVISTLSHMIPHRSRERFVKRQVFPGNDKTPIRLVLCIHGRVARIHAYLSIS